MSTILVYLILQPRKFRYKLRQKIRSIPFVSRKSKLNFGQGGLVVTQPLRFNSKNIFRLKLFIKKAARRSDNTKRKVWFNAFPHLPLTKKIIGARMGKGKGKLALWFTQVPTGHTLIELKNLRNGRLLYFLKQVQHKLKSSSKIIFRSKQKVINSSLGSDKIHFQSFW